MEDIVGGIIDWFIGWMISLSGTSYDLLKIEMGDGTTAGAVITAVWDFLSPFAMTLTVVFFGIDLNKKMVFEGTDVTLKTFAFPFIKLAVAFVVISNGKEIFDAVSDICNYLMQQADAIDVAAEAADELKENHIGAEIAKTLGFWGLIAALLPLLVSIMVGLICNLVWYYKAFTFKCEFVGRYLFAPIALADVYSGANTAAIRYIKGTIAFGLYGVCLILLPKLVNAVAIQTVIDKVLEQSSKVGVLDGIGGAFEIIGALLIVVVAPIAAIGIVGAAKQITKEALGA